MIKDALKSFDKGSDSSFAHVFSVLEENQAGFRAGYSTADHIFVLYALIEFAKAQKRKFFCSFIDFNKAFVSVW